MYLMHRRGMEFLETLGYARYEISNYAKPGFASLHNLNYWENGVYLGLGLNSHSAMRINGSWMRFANTERLSDYIVSCNQGIRPLASEPEVIPRAEEMFETVMLGLRKTEGISEAAFRLRFGKSIEDVYPEALKSLATRGWLVWDNGACRLTDEGLDFQNEALLAFLPD